MNVINEKISAEILSLISNGMLIEIAIESVLGITFKELSNLIYDSLNGGGDL